MSFKRLEEDDFVVSADSITAGIWSGNVPELTSFYTSSTQAAGSSGKYYVNVFDTAATSSIQFALAYGNLYGSGSEVFDADVDGKSPTATNYGQYRSLVLGDENASFTFGGVNSQDFFVISVDRSRYKETLFPGSLTLKISGSGGVQTITDNSQVVTSVQFKDSGRVFELVSGSAGSLNTSVNSEGYTNGSGSYGWLLPDIGTILLNPNALSASFASGGIALVHDGWDSGSAAPTVTPYSTLFNSISDASAASFTLNSQETITSDYVFVRPRSSEFNYSENPSFISGSTGEVLYDDFINNPQVYMTTVGLYNDNNELLAVAKLSKPLLKDFTKESLVRVKLDF